MKTKIMLFALLGSGAAFAQGPLKGVVETTDAQGYRQYAVASCGSQQPVAFAVFDPAAVSGPGLHLIYNCSHIAPGDPRTGSMLSSDPGCEAPGWYNRGVVGAVLDKNEDSSLVPLFRYHGVYGDHLATTEAPAGSVLPSDPKFVLDGVLGFIPATASVK